jgi:hypothetical protein
MSNTRIALEDFTHMMKRLARAFGKQINEDLMAEYYRVLGSMSAEEYSAIVDWAVRNLDTPFPTIARLRKEALQRGWLSDEPPVRAAVRRPQSRDDGFVEFVCPDCEGTFLIKRKDLLAEASAGRVFECVNARHWGCKRRISATELLQQSDFRS